jgi:LPXTG-motif cell wall-anchored protein
VTYTEREGDLNVSKTDKSKKTTKPMKPKSGLYRVVKFTLTYPVRFLCHMKVRGAENEPTPEDELKEPLGITPPSEVKTYTTALELVKTDAIGNRLQGAEFTLTGNSMKIVRVTKSTFEPDENGTYWKLTDNSYTTTDPNSTIDGAPVDVTKYADTKQKYTKVTTTTFEEGEGEEVTITGTVGEDGILRFEGLGVGEFTIKEIKAPEGYNILTEELKVNISWDKTTGDFTYEGAVDNNGVARITIVNQAGSELPSTGGIGTTMFYVFGGILVLAAVVLLVTKKRMAVK